MKIFTKEDIDNIHTKLLKGERISRSENIFYERDYNTRKLGIKYYYDNKELIEYSKCYNDIFYFAEKYCDVILRDYQIDILKNLMSNKKVINMSSHQMGIILVHNIYYLYKMIFTNNFNILYLSNKIKVSMELLNKFKALYFKLPFFIKQGIEIFNSVIIKFENGSSIRIKEVDDITEYNIVSLNEFSRMCCNEELFYKYNNDNSQFFIISQPNGNNLFYTLVQDSERSKNDFHLIKTYWWQIPSRDEKWKLEEIRRLGSEIRFNQEYDLYFISR